MNRNIQRRDVLKGVGAASIAGLAGCTSEDSDGSGGGGGSVPDAVMVVGFPQSGVQLFRDFYSEFASDTPDLDIVVPDGLMDSNLPGEVDNDMNNVIGTQPSAGGPGADFFTSEYQAAYGEEPGVFTAQAYDAMAINILATVAAGENTGSAIRDRIRTVANPGGEQFGPETLVDAVETVAGGDPVHYVGASSSADFDVNGDIVTAAYDVTDFQDGELSTLDTLEFGSELTEEDNNAVAEDPVGVDSFEAMIGVLMPETATSGRSGFRSATVRCWPPRRSTTPTSVSVSTPASRTPRPIPRQASQGRTRWSTLASAQSSAPPPRTSICRWPIRC